VSWAMEKFSKKSGKKSLFDVFEEEINNEESMYDSSNNRESMSMDVGNSSIGKNTNLNNQYDCKAMVKYFLKIIM